MEQSKKVYTLNFWYGYNYGASLTAFALYTLLLNKGYEVSLINNMSDREQILQKKYFSQKFISEYCNLTDNINDYNTLRKIDESAPIYLTGSDQVFRPILAPNKTEQFYLDFANIDSLKIAVSASFGVNQEQFCSENSAATIEQIKKSLSSFDYISVREKSGVDICKNIFGVDAKWIIDPVFMIDKQYYIDIAKKSKKDYSNSITSYIFNKDKAFNKIYKILEKRFDAQVETFAFKNKPMEDWLSAIINSKLVITDSFHGICFSIMFNKPFICPAKGTKTFPRFASIFEQLGIDNQAVTPEDVLEKDCIFKLDYENIQKNIEQSKEEGINFIFNAMNSTQRHKDLKEQLAHEYWINFSDAQKQRNSIIYRLKRSIWLRWIYVYTFFLPEFVKKIIKFIWRHLKNE